MILHIIGHAIWLVIGFLIATVCYKTIPQIRAIKAAKNAKQQRANSYPQAYKISKPYTSNKN